VSAIIVVLGCGCSRHVKTEHEVVIVVEGEDGGPEDKLKKGKPHSNVPCDAFGADLGEGVVDTVVSFSEEIVFGFCREQLEDEGFFEVARKDGGGRCLGEEGQRDFLKETYGRDVYL